MRRFCCALVVLGWLASPAAAQDFALLRGMQTVGPATFTRWTGFYVGGQFGLSNGSADFSQSTGPGIATALQGTYLEADFAPSQWATLGIGNASAVSFGGFLGYNAQWQDLILGIEANFNRSTLRINAPDTPVARDLPKDGAGNAWSLVLTGTGSMTTFDSGTFRARAGYVVGDFLPYGFIGMALGIANVSISSTLAGLEWTSGTVGTPPSTPVSFSGSAGGNMEVLYGFAVGGGVDVLLTPNIFVRAEFEFDQFRPPPDISLWMVTARVGAGWKF